MNFHSFCAGKLSVAGLIAAATLAFAGCGGGGGSGLTGCLSYGGGGGGGGYGGGGSNCNPSGPAPSPSPTPDASAEAAALLLTGQTATNNGTYGMVLGYDNGNSATGFASNVVNFTANQAVQFYSVEASSGPPHTASSLGAWSGSFPANGPTAAQQNPSAAGTSISAAGFSTGTIQPGKVSAVYQSGGPGMTVLGCFYHYQSNSMRTVAIVM